MRKMINRYTEKVIRETSGGKLVRIQDKLFGTIKYNLYNSTGVLVSTFTI